MLQNTFNFISTWHTNLDTCLLSSCHCNNCPGSGRVRSSFVISVFGRKDGEEAACGGGPGTE
jgi:hypothetical protein